MNGHSTYASAQKGESGSILNEITTGQIYIACGYTDMRRSIDGLAAMVQKVLKLDPYKRNLFLFCGKKSDRMKALYYEGDGFVLFYKRLERGRFQWPRKESEARQITRRQLRWLLEGLRVEQASALTTVEPKRMI